MSRFVVARDRDAWGIIRGYVYQVDLTIERWLELKPHQSLQLECGEDIDLISRAHQSAEDEGQRILEQVKYRNASITLRSPECIEAIANAIEHQVVNPDFEVLFRFTTNANAGIERLSPLPGVAAIRIWEQLRNDELPQPKSTASEQGILTLLQDHVERDNKPHKLHGNTWSHFKNFIGGITDDQLSRLIKNFEWSTGGVRSTDMASRLQFILLSNHVARDEHEAREQYLRLFLFVFQCLCLPGRKVLTIGERDAQLRLPTLSTSDHAQLQDVKTWLLALSTRLTAVEQALNFQQESLASLTDQFRALALPNNSTAILGHMIAPPMLDLPPLVEHLSRRHETVQNLVIQVNRYGWTAIHGAAGSGKSLLATLVAHELGSCRAWIRFRDIVTTEEACRHLDEVCAFLSGLNPQRDWELWYSQLCEAIGSGQFLVLDDLPRLTSGDPLAERLLRLAQVGYHQRVHLLSTSNFSLPTGLQQRIRKQTLMTLSSPVLTDSEAADILQAYGAPLDQMEPRFVHTVNILTQKHPQLLAAAARYMSERNWRWTGTEFEILLRSQYAETINDETMDKLLGTVEDSQSLELLYRLNIPFGGFSQDTVQVLAAVEPAIDRPRERLRAITGLWVQRDAEERLLVSPLIKSLGSSELPQDRLFSCHAAVGDHIMRQGKLTSFDLSYAVTHFNAAQNFERAGAILAWSLSQLHSHLEAEHRPSEKDPAGLLSFWWDTPLPLEMSLSVRLYLRAQQIATGDAIGKDVSGLIPHIAGLATQATETEAILILATIGIAGHAIAKYDFALTCRLTVRALELLPHARLPDGSPVDFPAPPSSFVWWHLVQIKSLDHVMQWMDMVEQIDAEQRTQAFDDELAEDGCVMLANRAWMMEAGKPQDEQEWKSVLDTLQSLERRAWQVGLHTLWASAVRAQIVVLAEYCKDLQSALDAAETALRANRDNKEVLFLIGEATGRVCGYARKFAEAALWLERALTETGNTHSVTRFRALQEAAWFTGSQDLQKPIKYLRQAIDLAKTIDELSEIEIVKALGELAIAYHLSGDAMASFKAFDEAAERLFNCREDTEDWKGLFVIFGHVAGYLSSMARYGHPPREIAVDGDPYVAPERGTFLRYTPSMAASLYTELNALLLPELMAMFAEATGHSNRSATWALEGISVTEKAGQPSLTALSVITALPYLLDQNRFTDVLNALHNTAPAFVASVQNGRNADLPIEMDLDVNAILGPKEHDGWRKAENFTAEVGLIPAFLRVSTLAVEDPAKASGYAADVATACRQISKGAVIARFWIEAADLVEEVFSQSVSSKSLDAKGELMIHRGQRELAIISLIGATLQEDTRLEDCIAAHIRVAASITSAYKHISSLNVSIVFPFFYDYWLDTFQKKRFCFLTPRLVEEQIAKVQHEPVDRRIQVLLRTISEGLGMGVPDWAHRWLYT